MEQPISQHLHEMMMFAILGFFIAALYEPFRISRILIKTGVVATGIQDFLFLAASGLTVFAYSLEFGEGYFRYFYLIGIAFGAAVYFLTVGKLIIFVVRTFAEAIKIAIKYIIRFTNRVLLLPIRNFLVHIAQKAATKAAKISDSAKKHHLALKNTTKIKYNSIQVRKTQSINTQRKSNEVKKAPIKARVIKSTQKS